MSGFAFHPEGFTDLADIWEFNAEDNIDAADRVIADILDAVRALVGFRHQGHSRRTSRTAFCVSCSCATTWLPTRPRKALCG